MAEFYIFYTYNRHYHMRAFNISRQTVWAENIRIIGVGDLYALKELFDSSSQLFSEAMSDYVFTTVYEGDSSRRSPSLSLYYDIY
jgi:hypothetical protein